MTGLGLQTPVQRWLYALKPASWPKLIVPMLLGQGIGLYAADTRASLGGAAFGLVFTVLELVFIVLLNDWFDAPVDAIKRSLFPRAGSPKTIPDRILAAPVVLTGGIIAGALALASAFVFAFVDGRGAGFWLASVGCLFIFTAYTLPPLRLNYRGGGELLEMLGAGVALPWLCAYAVSGRPSSEALWALPGFAVLSLASAIASGLSDEVSDRAGGKRTFTSELGNRFSRRAAEVCLLGGAIVWLVTALLRPRSLPPLAAVPAAALTVWFWLRVRRLSERAVTNAFAAHTAYKLELHGAIWCGGALLAALLAVARH